MERILNVAVATDTILYAPFYTAWFGGDFDKTPFKNVSVNVIARENDSFFRNDIFKNLKAVDGFVTLCLVFDYADVGICDPSFIIQACKTEDDSLLRNVFNEFYAALSDIEQISFKDNHCDLFMDNDIVVAKLKKEINNKVIKIIGGLISRVAFSLIGNQELGTQIKNEAKPFVGRTHFGDALRPFAKTKIKNVIYFPEPSTGHCVGSILRDSFGSASEMPSPEKTEYGKEIDEILNLDTSKAGNTLALTCDFVSVDFINSKGFDVKEKDSDGNIIYEELKDDKGTIILGLDRKPAPDKTKPKYKKKNQKLFEIEDWVMSRTKTAMFTGILAVIPEEEEKKGLIQAFLYGIDKNLFEINKNIDKGKTALASYFKSKLDMNHPKLNEETLLKLLIAYPEIEGKCTIDELIYFYVNRLTKWKKEESPLYYNSIKPDFDDLKEIYKIRLKGYSQTSNLSDVDLHSFVQYDLLNQWHKDEKKIYSYNNNLKYQWYLRLFKIPFWRKLIWNFFTDENRVLNFAAAFITLEIIALLVKLTNYHPFEIKTEGEINFSIWKCPICISYNQIAIAVFVGLIYLTYRAVKWGKRLNHLKEKEDFIFRK